MTTILVFMNYKIFYSKLGDACGYRSERETERQRERERVRERQRQRQRQGERQRDRELLSLIPRGDKHIQSLASSCYFHGSLILSCFSAKGHPPLCRPTCLFDCLLYPIDSESRVKNSIIEYFLGAHAFFFLRSSHEYFLLPLVCFQTQLPHSLLKSTTNKLSKVNILCKYCLIISAFLCCTCKHNVLILNNFF